MTNSNRPEPGEVLNYLNEVHNYLKEKYESETDVYAENAKKLEEYLKNLKEAAKSYGKKNSLFGDTIYETILNNIQTTFAKKNKKSVRELFRKTGQNTTEIGDILEKDLARTFAAVFMEISGKKAKETWKNFQTGGVQVSIDKTIVGTVEEAIQRWGKGNYNTIKTAIGDNDFKTEYKQAIRNIKTDVNGLPEVTISREPSEELKKLYELLKDATISAKNYTTSGDKNKTRKISLGSTDEKKAIMSVLSDIGNLSKDSKEAEIYYYAATNLKGKETSENREHIEHLKFIYELSGLGQGKMLKKQLGVEIKDAKYIIWNDRSTDNIYVQSTAKLISDMYKDGLDDANHLRMTQFY